MRLKKEEIEEIKKELRPITLSIKENSHEKEYLKSLREWEKGSKRSDLVLSGPVRNY